MTAATQSPFSVQTLNSNHSGVEFGVVVFDETLTNLTLDECRALLAVDGWSDADLMPSVKPGIHKFLVSRRK
jgi:hypothetical protein